MPPQPGGVFAMGERDQLQAIVSRLVKRNYLPPNQPHLHDIVATADLRLFHSNVNNPHHVAYIRLFHPQNHMNTSKKAATQSPTPSNSQQYVW